MTRCIITTATITIAMHGQRVLGDYAVGSRLIKLSGTETKQGCAHGIEVDCNSVENARRILDRNNVRYTTVIYR